MNSIALIPAHATLTSMPNEALFEIMRFLMTPTIEPHLSPPCNPSKENDDSSEFAFPTAILRINRQLQLAAMTVFYKEDKFVFKITKRNAKRREIALSDHKPNLPKPLNLSCTFLQHAVLQVKWTYFLPEIGNPKMRSDWKGTHLVRHMTNICQHLATLPLLQSVNIKMVMQMVPSKRFNIKVSAMKQLSEILAPINSLPLTVEVGVDSYNALTVPLHWLNDAAIILSEWMQVRRVARGLSRLVAEPLSEEQYHLLLRKNAKARLMVNQEVNNKGNREFTYSHFTTYL